MQLQNLNLPPFDFQLKKKDEKLYIRCIIRGKDILLTPEEWVRQHFILFLMEHKNYPKNLIAVEKQIKVNQLTKRFDILAYGTNGNPLVLIECKAPKIELSQAVFAQATNYNMTLQVPHLIITNGLQHLQSFINFKTKTATLDNEIRNYDELQT